MIKAFVVIMGVYSLILGGYLVSTKPINILDLYNDRVYEQLNEVRRKEGAGVLNRNKYLEKSARLKAKQIEKTCKWDHSIESEKDWSRLITKAGYKGNSKGEVLARGFKEADNVVSGWMNSPTHYNVIMDDYKDYGVYTWISKCDNKVYVVGHFGK